MAETESGQGDQRPAPLRAALSPGRWPDVPVLAYKQDADSPFEAVTRRVLFAAPELDCELRYFEVDRGGHSTLERHEHAHAVVVHRGCGQCLVGHDVRDIGVGDLVSIAPMTWHQFRANRGEPLGFLCMVNVRRDKPRQPTREDLEALKAVPAIATFLKS